MKNNKDNKKTTIQISKELLVEIENSKLCPQESWEHTISRLLSRNKKRGNTKI